MPRITQHITDGLKISALGLTLEMPPAKTLLKEGLQLTGNDQRPGLKVKTSHYGRCCSVT